MKTFSVALWAEYKKIINSKILWGTVILFTFIPCMMGLMIYIVRHPEISEKLGLIAAKASLFGDADWQGFFGILHQSMATVGLIGFGFVTAWVFGREYIERTVKDILALAVSRTHIVVAKFVVVIIWGLLLSLILYTTGILMGMMLHVENWTTALFYEQSLKYFKTALMTLLLCSPVAFFASYGRGLIAPIGFVIISLITAQFIAVIGLGAYFPWSIPGVYSVSGTAEGMNVYTSSYLILLLTFLIGFFGTIQWWRVSDQH